MPPPILPPAAPAEIRPTPPGSLVDWWKKPRTRWAAACFGVIFLIVLYCFPDASGTASSGLSASANTDEITLMARLDANEMTIDEQHILVVEIANHGKTPVSSLGLHINAPGFGLTQPKPEDCHNPLSPMTNGSLPADQTCVFRIPVTALAASGHYDIAVEADFLQPKYRTLTLHLGHVHLHGFFGVDSLVRFGSRLGQVLKDFTLPFFLLGLTTVFGRWQKSREEVRADQERTRAERQQVRQLLLNKVTDMAEKHYLRIASAGKGFLNSYKDLEKNRDAPSGTLFYYAMLLIWNVLKLRDERGGPFFLDRQAEQVFALAWSILRPTLFAIVGEDQINASVKIFKTDASLDYFSRRIGRLKGAEHFASWVKGEGPEWNAKYGPIGQYIPLVDLLQGVAQFETNLPLNEFWYRESTALRCANRTLEMPQGTALTNGQLDAIARLPSLFEPYWDKNQQPRRFPD